MTEFHLHQSAILKIRFSYIYIPGFVVCIIKNIQLTLKLNTSKVFKCLSRVHKIHEIASKWEVLYVYVTKLCGSWIQLWSLLYTFHHCEVSDQLIMVGHVTATVTEERRVFNILYTYLWELTKITHTLFYQSWFLTI